MKESLTSACASLSTVYRLLSTVYLRFETGRQLANPRI
jgi:hypothetical protein